MLAELHKSMIRHLLHAVRTGFVFTKAVSSNTLELSSSVINPHASVFALAQHFNLRAALNTQATPNTQTIYGLGLRTPFLFLSLLPTPSALKQSFFHRYV